MRKQSGHQIVHLLTLALVLLASAEQARCNDPDEYVATPMLIVSKGYPVEEHQVQTDDGYLLTMHRIPYGRKERGCRASASRPVVFLQHGLLDSSSTFVINMADQSLGFMLADAGYDVWLGNVRGNKYSSAHVKLDVNSDAFWDFSFNEMGKYDMPAMLNYALEYTNQSQLVYIGHSQGTMMGFLEFSQNEALQAKIKLFIALAPVARVGQMISPLKYVADMGKVTNQNMWFTLFGRRSFLPSTMLTEWLASILCNMQATQSLVCQNIIFVLCGPSLHMNNTRLPVYTTHAPSGTSVKNLIHFAQLAVNGKFQEFDYFGNNMRHYNQSQPPAYNVGNMKAPVALYWSYDDWLADPEDVAYLRQILPNIVDDASFDKYNHMDFIWAINANTFIYNRVLDLISKYA